MLAPRRSGAGSADSATTLIVGAGVENIYNHANKIVNLQKGKPIGFMTWGLGGFAIKETTVRWLDATDDLKAISISVGAKEKAVQAKVQLTLGAAK